MKKGFTLIEIIIVISIIAILLTVTMRFWSSRIDILKYQAGKEQFVNAYDRLYTQHLTSNYHEWTRYESLTLRLGSSGFNYFWDTGEVQYVTTTMPFAISGIDETSMVFKPYVVGCDMETGVVFQLIVDEKKTYCFSIKNDTCKLVEERCE